MATVVKSKRFIDVSAIAADWDMAALYPQEMECPNDGFRIKRITFKGDTNDDVLVIKEGSASGAVITILGTEALARPDREYFGDNGTLMKPFIDQSECTLTGTHTVVFELVR